MTGGISFRFLDKIDKDKIKKSEVYKKVEQLENELEKYGITVEFYENIDIKDALKENKFTFRIYDNNNCFVEVNALEYRKIVLDANVSEVDYIVERLFKMLGLKVQDNALRISELIVELISYVYYFDELQCKVYNDIGWDLYNNELIFKYDIIYRKNSVETISACTNEIAGNLTAEYDDNVKERWINMFADLMNSSVEARIVISSACTGLVRSLIPYDKENNINMNIVGAPGSGKSSLCQYALSLFADPRVVEGSFTDTDNAMEIIRIKRPVIPYVLDDRLLKIDKLSESNQGRELMFDIFREYEGKVTERAGGAYKNLSGKRTNAPIISSSVEPIMEVLRRSGKDLGQYRRFIEIELKKDKIFEGKSSVVSEYKNMTYQNYGIGFEYIVKYILNIGKNAVKFLYDYNQKFITQVLLKKEEEVGVKGLDASASRFALIVTTYMIIREAFNTSGVESTKRIGASTEEIMEVDAETVHKIFSETKEGEIEKSTFQAEMLFCKDDACCDEMLEYLSENLISKMKKVKVEVDVYENIVAFIDKYGSTWLSSSNKTNFFKSKEEKIALIQKVGNSTKLMFRDNKSVEKILCAGVELTDEQIKEYILAINNSAGFNEIAKQYLGDALFDVDYKKEIMKHDFMSFEEETRAGNEQTPASITIRPIENEEDK